MSNKYCRFCGSGNCKLKLVRQGTSSYMYSTYKCTGCGRTYNFDKLDGTLHEYTPDKHKEYPVVNTVMVILASTVLTFILLFKIYHSL